MFSVGSYFGKLSFYLSSFQVKYPNIHQRGSRCQSERVKTVTVHHQDVGAQPLQDVRELHQGQPDALHHGCLIFSSYNGVELGADIEAVLLNHTERVSRERRKNVQTSKKTATENSHHKRVKTTIYISLNTWLNFVPVIINEMGTENHDLQLKLFRVGF